MSKLLFGAFFCLALASISPAQTAPPKQMDAPAYAFGQGTIIDTSQSVLILPNGALPGSCKTGQAFLVGGTLNLCSSTNTWVAVPMLTNGQIAPSVLPGIGSLVGTLTAGQLPATINANTTGIAGTANALANTTTCPAGQYSTGIATSGAANCTAVQAGQVSGLAPSGLIDTTNAANIASGTLNQGRLPASVLFGSQANLMNGVAGPGGSPAAGGLFFWADAGDKILKAKNDTGAISITVFPGAAPVHQAITGIAPSGVLQFSQLSAGDILGLAKSATTDTTDAGGILTGVFNPSRLPPAGPATLGGVNSFAYTAHQWINSIGTDGSVHASQPQASDILGLSASATSDTTNAENVISGVLNPLRLPAAGTNSLGAVNAFAPQAHQWLNGVSTSGVFSSAQPSLADIAGSLSGDLSGPLAGVKVVGVNGTTFPATNAVNLVPVTTAQGAASWIAVPACADNAGQHLNYDAVNHVFSCGTSVPSVGIGFSSIGSGINLAAALQVGSGSSLAPTGTGTITANAYSGVLSSNNLPASLLYGNQVLTLQNQQPPASAIANSTQVWADANDGNLKAKNGTGYTSVTVFPQAPAAHQVVTGVANNGSVSTAQLTADDIQGLVASATVDTTDASNILKGILPAARLPLPTANTPGVVLAVAPSPHQWVDSIGTNGIPHQSQVQIADINGAAPSASVDTTSASNINKGTLPLAQLPTGILLSGQINILNQVAPPSGVPAVGNVNLWADSQDGNLKTENHTGSVSVTVQPQAPITHKFANGVSSGGIVSLAQPQAADILGLSASALTDTTNANNIQSGTLSNSLFPATIASNTSGNAATASALSSTPTACPGGQFATGIAANGNAICSVITLQQLMSGNSGGNGASGNTLTISASNVVGGVLSDSVMPNDVVNSVAGDVNVTGSINSKLLTLGWTGTLAANRLNNNVVQAVTNDSNVIGSINNQNLTLGFSGQLPITRGGTGASSKMGAFNALAPTTTLGDIIYSDGVSNQRLPGNTAATTNYLCQTGTGTSSAAPQWCQFNASSITGLAPSAYTNALNASNINTGTLPNAQVPQPTANALGGVKAYAVGQHQWLAGLDTSGAFIATRPGAADITGLAPSATSDTTDADNILTGSIKNSLLPATITASTTGNAATTNAFAIAPGGCTIGQYSTGINANGSANCATIQYQQIGNLPTIPTDDAQLANSANYITGTQVPSFLPVTAVLNNQVNTYLDQFEAPTPADGYTQVWTDKVNMVLTAKNWQGYRTITVGPSQAPPNQWANGLTLNGIITYAPIQAWQIQGLSTSGMIDVTNASNITTGTLPLNIFPVTINSNTTGNAATATSLQTNPQICLGDQVSAGILANGNAVCKAAPSSGGGSGGGDPIATTTSLGVIIPSTGLDVDQTGDVRVAYGKTLGTSLGGALYGTPNGVATLDGNGLVPQSELPYVNKVQLPITSLPGCNASTSGQLAHIAGATSGSTDQVGACIYDGTKYVWLWFGSGSGGTGGGTTPTENLYRTFQNVTSLTWAHNANSLSLIPTIWGTDGSIFSYNSFTLSDANDASLTFAVPASGAIRLSPASYSLQFVNAVSVQIPHNLNTQNLIPIIYSGDGSVIDPNTFTLSLSDYNNAVVTFATPQSGTIQILAGTGSNSISQSFTSSSGVNVTHNLGVSQVAISVWDSNQTLVGYTSWIPSSTNAGVLTMANPMSGRVVVVSP